MRLEGRHCAEHTATLLAHDAVAGVEVDAVPVLRLQVLLVDGERAQLFPAHLAHPPVLLAVFNLDMRVEIRFIAETHRAVFTAEGLGSVCVALVSLDLNSTSTDTCQKDKVNVTRYIILI